MMRIKICGITDIEDAEIAAENGATDLGFNFYEKSPRFIEFDKAAEIISRVSSRARPVGVFVNADAEFITQAVKAAKLACIQLHGDETGDFVSNVKKITGLEVIKAIRVKDDFCIKDLENTAADAILLDAFAKSAYGGTGETLDWTLAAKACRKFGKVYLAGGLGAANVAEAVRQVRPFGVDSCSSIEHEPGKKDHTKMVEFLNNASEAGRNLLHHE